MARHTGHALWFAFLHPRVTSWTNVDVLRVERRLPYHEKSHFGKLVVHQRFGPSHYWPELTTFRRLHPAGQIALCIRHVDYFALGELQFPRRHIYRYGYLGSFPLNFEPPTSLNTSPCVDE